MANSSRKTALSSRLLEAVLPRLGAGLLWSISVTLRLRMQGDAVLNDFLAAGRPVLIASWHNRLLTGMYMLRRYRPLVMVSQSRDGERIARVAERFGYRPVRGSSSRGGARALLQLVRRLRKGEAGIHLVDGPRGPLGELKPGLLLIAQRSGAVILPIYAQATRRWRTRSWDLMEIPKPFARLVARVGRPVEVPTDLTPEAAEELRLALQAEMGREYARLAADLAEGGPIPGPAHESSLGGGSPGV